MYSRWLFEDEFDTDLREGISLTKTAVSVFIIVTVPVLIGMAVRKVAETLSLRLERVTKKISASLFVFVLLGAIYQERNNIAEYLTQAGLITLVLNVLMMAIAYRIAVLFATGLKQRVSIAIECGLQNGTLAIAVASLMFGGGLVVIPAATYSLLMFITALIYIAFLRHNVSKGEGV